MIQIGIGLVDGCNGLDGPHCLRWYIVTLNRSREYEGKVLILVMVIHHHFHRRSSNPLAMASINNYDNDSTCIPFCLRYLLAASAGKLA